MFYSLTGSRFVIFLFCISSSPSHVFPLVVPFLLLLLLFFSPFYNFSDLLYLVLLYRMVVLCCNCINDRLPERHSCLNLYPCVIKFGQLVSQSVSQSLFSISFLLQMLRVNIFSAFIVEMYNVIMSMDTIFYIQTDSFEVVKIFSCRCRCRSGV